MSGRNTTDLILPVEQRAAAGELKKHELEIGQRYVFCDKKSYPLGKMYAVVRAVKKVAKQIEHIKPRKHTVDSLMMFLGDNDDLSGLEVEVTLGGRNYRLQSPASVYVPASLTHNYKFIRGSGKYVKIVLAPSGDYNLVTE